MTSRMVATRPVDWVGLQETPTVVGKFFLNCADGAASWLHQAKASASKFRKRKREFLGKDNSLRGENVSNVFAMAVLADTS